MEDIAKRREEHILFSNFFVQVKKKVERQISSKKKRVPMTRFLLQIEELKIQGKRL